MNLSPRNRLIVTAAAVVLIVVVLAVVLVLPQVRRLSSVRMDIEDAIDRSEAAQSLLEQRRQVRNQASVTDAKLIQLAVAIPENPDLPSLIIDLQDTAYDTGVVIMSVAPAEPEFTEGAAYVGLPVELEVWGTWADTVDFMQRLQKTDRELRTTKYTVEVLPPPNEELGSEAGLSYPPYYQVRTNINVRAYVIPSSETTAPPTVPTPTE